jgi:acetyl-CoA acetyltransferase
MTDRTPVLIGIGAVSQREPDPERALEPVALMARALERAADDAGSRGWLERADAIAVPRGFWSYADPARLVAERVKAARAKSQLAEIGVLQTTLFARACRAIAQGEAEVVLVTGERPSTARRTTSAPAGRRRSPTTRERSPTRCGGPPGTSCRRSSSRRTSACRCVSTP